MALLVENSFVRGRKDAGFLPMRAALGGTMIYHGLSKLKEEENRQEAGQMFEQIGIRPGRLVRGRRAGCDRQEEQQQNERPHGFSPPGTAAPHGGWNGATGRAVDRANGPR